MFGALLLEKELSSLSYSALYISSSDSISIDTNEPVFMIVAPVRNVFCRGITCIPLRNCVEEFCNGIIICGLFCNCITELCKGIICGLFCNCVGAKIGNCDSCGSVLVRWAVGALGQVGSSLLSFVGVCTFSVVSFEVNSAGNPSLLSSGLGRLAPRRRLILPNKIINNTRCTEDPFILYRFY